MKPLKSCLTFGLVCTSLLGASAAPGVEPPPGGADLDVKAATVRLDQELEQLVFEMVIEGTAGGTRPTPRGQQDGAPVLAYVFPTTLRATDVGFSSAEGIVALVATSHPDFDDTPLWDENGDTDRSNDGATYHTHWVILVKDERVPGKLAVRQFEKEDRGVRLPPTNPGMPMYMDSPGFPVVLREHTLRTVVPLPRVRGRSDFSFDAVTAYLEVNTSDPSRPLLGVYEVYDVLSGDLSLPNRVTAAGRGASPNGSEAPK